MDCDRQKAFFTAAVTGNIDELFKCCSNYDSVTLSQREQYHDPETEL